MEKNNKFWQFRNESSEEKAELLLYGEISNETWVGDEVTPKQFATDLQAMGGKDLIVHVNSPGGDVFAAHAIYNQLKAYSGQVTAYVDGLAASAATIITCAADKVVMPSNALFMIHNPSVGVMDYLDEKKAIDLAENLQKVKQSIINVYLKRCQSLKAEELQEMMDNETWLDAKEAIEYGFADEQAEYEVKNSIADGVAHFNNVACSLKRFSNVAQLKNVLSKEKESEDMKDSSILKAIQEIKDLLGGNKGEDPAVIAERERVQALDALKDGSQLVDALVDIAKAKGDTAEKMADYIEAVKADSEEPNLSKGIEEIKNLIIDQQNSGAKDVAPAGEEKKPEVDAVNELVKAMNNMRGEK